MADKAFLTNGVNRLNNRAEHDYYATDPRAVKLLFELEKFHHKIWEPACGEGHLSKEIRKHGYEVRESDIVDRMDNEVSDFLKCDGIWNGDIITNPPYNKAKEFVYKALDIIPDGYKAAMFLKLTFLEGKARRKLFEYHPPKKIYVSSSRLSCAKNGDFSHAQTAMALGWFIWERGYLGETIIDWFN